jgi:hypothetical protein
MNKGECLECGGVCGGRGEREGLEASEMVSYVVASMLAARRIGMMTHE